MPALPCFISVIEVLKMNKEVPFFDFVNQYGGKQSPPLMLNVELFHPEDYYR